MLAFRPGQHSPAVVCLSHEHEQGPGPLGDTRGHDSLSDGHDILYGTLISILVLATFLVAAVPILFLVIILRVRVVLLAGIILSLAGIAASSPRLCRRRCLSRRS